MAFLFALLAALSWNLVVILVSMAITRRSAVLTRAPMLDVVVSLLTWAPWIWGAFAYGWTGFFGVLVGQAISLQVFCLLHGYFSRYRGPKIRHALDRVASPARNQVGLWVTVPALPAFWMLRFAEVFVYPGLVWSLNFPRYNHAEWVNVSRHKFGGLVGHDLVWCLYCDWMTGVFSLAGEMLRNVESFWCPIRFYPGKKCENCKLDFPDVERWVEPRNATMKDVHDLLLEKYPPGSKAPRSWWGHSDRQPAGGGCGAACGTKSATAPASPSADQPPSA